MAEETFNTDTKVGERRKGERREPEDRKTQQKKFELPVIILNTGFILFLQLVVIIIFCD